ncbi:MAG: glycosyltransferase family 2 protein [Acidobacteria bacterium]|nr:glycosyltransferase family 2 protein [Acidobacteriota bacterium]
MNSDLSVVIPAYNEQDRLPTTLSRLRRYLDGRQISYEIIVVDDGSQDRTLAIAKQLRSEFPQLHVLSNGQNRGKGFSVRRGFLQACGPLVLFTDSDLSAPVEELAKLERALEGNDGAIASRALPESEIFKHQSFFRELSGKCFNLMVRALTGLRFHDTQCGFKLFRRIAFLPVFESQSIDGFAFDVEILYLARKMGLRVAEIPVRWGHAEGSRLQFFPDAVRMLLELLKVRWRHG